MTKPTWFDNRLSIGNLITIFMVAVTIIGGWFSFEGRLTRQQDELTRQQRQIESLVLAQAAYFEQRQDINVKLARIEEQLINLSRVLSQRGAFIK